MRLVTWNVNSLTARLPYVVEWIRANDPDVLCMQETKLADEAFPEAAFHELGYESAHHGDGRWNGVAVVSKVGLEAVERGLGSDEDAQGCRLIAATCAGVRVHSVYVPNGRSVDSEHYVAKLAWLKSLRTYLAQRYDPSGAVALCGDFNVAPRDVDVWDPEHFVGMTHVSVPERAALADVVSWGLTDVVATMHPAGGTFSWWDYRGGSFHLGKGMRIDLLLLTTPLARSCVRAAPDRDARKKSPSGQKPSDHTAVVADMDLDLDLDLDLDRDQ